MKRILLINPPIYFDKFGQPHAIDVSIPPLGLVYLASYLNDKSATFKAEILDMAAEKVSLTAVRERILAEKYFATGITSMTPQLQGAVELAQNIKAVNPAIKIFLGGPHISSQPDFVQHFKMFDYAICGEAEKTFLNSLESILLDQVIDKIQFGEIIDNLDEIPIWDRQLINPKLYSKTAPLIFSRGCPFECYFCSRSAISPKVRYRSAENLIQEIEQHNLKNIDFQDDTFTLNQVKVKELCQKIIQKNLKLKWVCNTRIDLVDEELLKLMHQAGCQQINFGIESGSERVRQEIVNKGQFTNQQTHQVFHWCQKYQIKIAGYFILGHPTESTSELEETESLILKSPLSVIGLSLPTPFPGSKLYTLAQEDGVINIEKIYAFANKQIKEGYIGNYPVYLSKNINSEYILSEMKKINRQFFFRPRIIWQKLIEDIGSWSKLKFDIKNLWALVANGVPVRKIYK